MSAKTLKMRDVSKAGYTVYLNRAKDFYKSMEEARTAQRWSSVGLMAVHCAISLCDALMVFHLGQRAAGDDHTQIAELLSRVPVDGASSQAANLGRIIAKKNAVAYEDREFRQNEALDIVKQIERFYLWALNHFPKG